MNLITTTINCDKGEFPKLQLFNHKTFITIRFRQDYLYSSPSVDFFIHSTRELINFKNQVIGACDQVLKEDYERRQLNEQI